MILKFAAVGGAIAALLAPGVAAGAEPEASLPDVEDEVMCPICGTLLQLSESPQAERERALIRRLIDEGKTKDEIKDDLVAQYGESVLATPEDHGFGLVGWLVPVIGIALALLALGYAFARYRRARRPPPGSPRPTEEDERRLEADLARYDL